MEQREEKDASRTCRESGKKALLGFRRREDIGGSCNSREAMRQIGLKVGFLFVETRSQRSLDKVGFDVCGHVLGKIGLELCLKLSRIKIEGILP